MSLSKKSVYLAFATQIDDVDATVHTNKRTKKHTCISVKHTHIHTQRLP